MFMRELEYLVQAAASPRLKGAHAEWSQLARRAPKQMPLVVSVPVPPELMIADEKIFNPWTPSFVLPGQEHFRFNNVHTDRIIPLAATDDRLYVLLDDHREVQDHQLFGLGYHSIGGQRVGWIPCDKSGRPLGESRAQMDAKSGKSLKHWSTLQELPPFELPNHHITILLCACVDGDRLFVGTKHHGLMVFNLKEQKWRHIGPEQGLPATAVFSLIPTGDGRILAGGQSEGGSMVHFVVSSKDLSVRLMYRDGAKVDFPRRLIQAWRVGDEWWGLSDGVGGYAPLWRGLGTSDCRPAFPVPKQFAAIKPVELRYEPATDEIVVTELQGDNTMRWKPDEIRYSGATIRGVVVGRATSSVTSTIDSMASKPIFIGCGEKSPSVFPILVTPRGCWLMRQYDTVFLTAEDAARLPEAQKARVTAPVAGVPAVSPTAQARQAIATGQSQLAVELLHALLDKEPNNAEALNLLGFLAERPGVKTPDNAASYYERMAKLDDNDPAYTGLAWLMRHAGERGDAKRAAELEEQSYARFPEYKQILAERFRLNKPMFGLKYEFKPGAGNLPVFMLMGGHPFDPEPTFPFSVLATPPR